MQEEFDALKCQGTWVLVSNPSHWSVVRCKWVYKIKWNYDGGIYRYKDRLMAHGFTQEQGVDYSKTFSPVVRHSIVRLILAIAVTPRKFLFPKLIIVTSLKFYFGSQLLR